MRVMDMNELLIGTYTGRSDSRGIYRAVLDDDGRFCTSGLLAEARDPSYIALESAGGRLYAVDEQSGRGGVVSFARGAAGWQRTGRADSQGGAPCHLSISPEGDALAVANYEDGVVTLCALRDGALTGETQALPGRTDAPGRGRQECSHAHMCTFAQGRLLVCDLGCDVVRAFERQDGRWREVEPWLRLPAGAGPRHMAIGPTGAVYVLGELDSRLHVFLPDGGAETLPLTPDDRAGTLAPGQDNSGAGAIRLSPDGRRLLCTLRPQGLVCLLDLDEAGRAHYAGAFDCGGRNPRDAAFAGEYVVCACQDEGGLICLKPEKGGARVTDRLALGAPVCVLSV